MLYTANPFPAAERAKYRVKLSMMADFLAIFKLYKFSNGI
jgi:hypothetical protein